MSEDPRDDEELEAFLSRDSALSRRYRESGDEQPPAHVDAAILAASRWAVGADRTGADRTSADGIGADKTSADRDRRGARHAGSHAHASASWRRSSVARWSVPLAMAAVLVLAVTLTIMLERDPELDRILQRHDSPSSVEGEAFRERATAEADVAALQAPAPGTAVSPGLTAQSSEPSPVLPVAKQEAADVSPGDLSPQVKEQIAREPAQENRLAARKRSELSDEQVAADQSIRRDAPATLAEEQVAERVAPAQTPASPFPESISAETKSAEDSDVGIASVDEIASREEMASVDEIASVDEMARIDEARDESAFAGASALSEPEESLPLAVTTPGRQQALAPEPATVPEADRALAESAQPAEIVAAEPARDPAQWIEDIEELLARGRRADAIDSLEEFRVEYPDYELPPDLQALLPATTD